MLQENLVRRPLNEIPAAELPDYLNKLLQSDPNISPMERAKLVDDYCTYGHNRAFLEAINTGHKQIINYMAKGMINNMTYSAKETNLVLKSCYEKY